MSEGGGPVKLSLGDESHKSRVSFFGTIINFLVEHIFEKLFGARKCPSSSAKFIKRI